MSQKCLVFRLSVCLYIYFFKLQTNFDIDSIFWRMFCTILICRVPHNFITSHLNFQTCNNLTSNCHYITGYYPQQIYTLDISVGRIDWKILFSHWYYLNLPPKFCSDFVVSNEIRLKVVFWSKFVVAKVSVHILLIYGNCSQILWIDLKWYILMFSNLKLRI